MSHGFNFEKIDQLEKAWPKIKDHYLGKPPLDAESASQHLQSVGVQPLEAISQHAPEDMLLCNIALFSARIQDQMGFYGRGRILYQLGLPQARTNFELSGMSGEASSLLNSCDNVMGTEMEQYAHYYKGLVYHAMEYQPEALEAFKRSHAYDVLGNRPALKIIGELYATAQIEEGSIYLKDALDRNLISGPMLAHILMYLSLRRTPQSSVEHFTQMCLRSGKFFGDNQ